MKYIFLIPVIFYFYSCNTTTENQKTTSSVKAENLDSSIWKVDKFIYNNDTFDLIGSYSFEDKQYLNYYFGYDFLLRINYNTDSIYVNSSASVVWRKVNDSIIYGVSILKMDSIIGPQLKSNSIYLPVYNLNENERTGKQISECKVENAYVKLQRQYFKEDFIKKIEKFKKYGVDTALLIDK